MSDTSGRTSSTPFATYDPAGSCWRTSQGTFPWGSDEFSETWPRAGMTRSGTASRLPPSAPITAVTGCSSLPTPSATSYGSNQSPSDGAAVRPSLETMARHNMWPTPTARDWRSGTGQTREKRLAAGHQAGLPEVLGGKLNPTWVEWLMGFPLGWTDCEDSATP